ncbi:hypothetical protein CJ179_43435 [Rhodococcus sp. ACS1]|nr:hypothetical protein CJ179_43435 [Rhodococcus sp. ACS1]
MARTWLSVTVELLGGRGDATSTTRYNRWGRDTDGTGTAAGARRAGGAAGHQPAPGTADGTRGSTFRDEFGRLLRSAYSYPGPSVH